MVKQRIRFLGNTSDKKTVNAVSNATITHTVQDDGELRLEEVAVTYDSILQANGKFTLKIGGKVISNAISSLSTNSGFGFANLNTIIYKGTTIEVDIYNADPTNSGTAQLLVSVYEEKEMLTELEKLQIEIARRQLKQLGG